MDAPKCVHASFQFAPADGGFVAIPSVAVLISHFIFGVRNFAHLAFTFQPLACSGIFQQETTAIIRDVFILPLHPLLNISAIQKFSKHFVSMFVGFRLVFSTLRSPCPKSTEMTTQH